MDVKEEMPKGVFTRFETIQFSLIRVLVGFLGKSIIKRGIHIGVMVLRDPGEFQEPKNPFSLVDDDKEE